MPLSFHTCCSLLLEYLSLVNFIVIFHDSLERPSLFSVHPPQFLSLANEVSPFKSHELLSKANPCVCNQVHVKKTASGVLARLAQRLLR